MKVARKPIAVWAALAACVLGSSHCGGRSGLAVVAFGPGGSGQLGNGTTTDSAMPVTVSL
jgi:hypothetical protein